MTAGQGQYGQPAGRGATPEQPGAQGSEGSQGQPPYGQPPQGQPPYGQPPQGQPPFGHPLHGQPPYGQPPQGQPPYGHPLHGQPPYGPVPTGPGAHAPVERPVTVRAGIGAFVGSIVLSLVAHLITWLNWDTLTRTVSTPPGGLEDLSEEEAEAAAEMGAAMAGTLGTVGLVLGVLGTAVFALFVWFAWRGHNWARIVLWILAGLGVVLGLVGAGLSGALGVETLPVLTALSWFEWVFDAVAIVLLALAPSNEWYRYRTWQRATGRSG